MVFNGTLDTKSHNRKRKLPWLKEEEMCQKIYGRASSAFCLVAVCVFSSVEVNGM
jgi:hypothetical protein